MFAGIEDDRPKTDEVSLTETRRSETDLCKIKVDESEMTVDVKSTTANSKGTKRSNNLVVEEEEEVVSIEEERSGPPAPKKKKKPIKRNNNQNGRSKNGGGGVKSRGKGGKSKANTSTSSTAAVTNASSSKEKQKSHKDESSSGNGDFISRNYKGPFLQVRTNGNCLTVVNAPLIEDDPEKAQNKMKIKKNIHNQTINERNKLRGLHVSTLSMKYDADTTDASWMCVFCKMGPHKCGLGDLFGPYIMTTTSDEFQFSQIDPTQDVFKSKRTKQDMIQKYVAGLAAKNAGNAVSTASPSTSGTQSVS